jgi:hypothetical protein
MGNRNGIKKVKDLKYQAQIDRAYSEILFD